MPDNRSHFEVGENAKSKVDGESNVSSLRADATVATCSAERCWIGSELGTSILSCDFGSVWRPCLNSRRWSSWTQRGLVPLSWRGAAATSGPPAEHGRGDIVAPPSQSIPRRTGSAPVKAPSSAIGTEAVSVRFDKRLEFSEWSPLFRGGIRLRHGLACPRT